MKTIEMPGGLGITVDFPDDMSDEEIAYYADQYYNSDEYRQEAFAKLKERGQNAAAQINQWQQNYEAAPPDYSIKDALATVPQTFVPSAVKTLKAVGEAVMHPIDTGEALAKTAAGYGQKLGLPGHEYEPYADAMNDYFANRYGGWSNIKRTLADDPFGLGSDIAALFTGGAGLVKGGGAALGGLGAKTAAKALDKAGSGLMAVGKAADPLTVPWALYGKPIGQAAAGHIIDPLAKRFYQSALKLNMGFGNNNKPKISEKQRLAIIDAGLKNGDIVSAGGMMKVRGRMNDLAGQVKTAVKAMDDAGIPADPEMIARGALWGENRAGIDRWNVRQKPLEAYDNTIMDYLEQNWNRTKNADAQAGKESVYHKYPPQYQNNVNETTNAQILAEKELANQQKGMIENNYDRGINEGLIPDVLNGRTVRDVNNEYGINKDLLNGMARAVIRGGNADPFDILSGGALGAAFDSGDIAAAAALLGPLSKTPAAKSAIGIGLDRIGKNLAGNGSHALEPWRRGLMGYLYEAGRTEELNKKKKKD